MQVISEIILNKILLIKLLVFTLNWNLLRTKRWFYCPKHTKNFSEEIENTSTIVNW